MEIKKVTSNHNTTSAPKRKIQYIVIHYTAGTTSREGSAINVANWFRNPKCLGSADYIVDDKLIVQYNLDVENLHTWHCGGTVYQNKGGKMTGKVTNKNSIGIELCSNTKSRKLMGANDKGNYFTNETLDTAEKLIKYLMEKYNIPAENIVRHYDTTGKLCPGIVGWNADSGSEKEWWKFKDRFKGSNKPKEEVKIPTPNKTTPITNKSFLVRIKADRLNVRAMPDTKSKIVGTLRSGEVYTIVETKWSWGKLKSGIGWIHLGYTERV